MTSKSLLLTLLAALCLGVLVWFGLRTHRPDAPDEERIQPSVADAPAAALEAASLASAGASDATEPAADRTALTAPKAGTAAPAAAKAGPQAGQVTLEGRVVDERGQPVAGARVRAGAGWDDWLDLPEQAADWIKRGADETDADGRFSISGLEPGTVAVHARAAGYSPLDKSEVPLPSEARHDMGELQLALGAILSGRVVDEHGRAVEGARLMNAGDEADGPFAFFAAQRGQALATSAADGSFRIDTLACGPWRLLVSSKAHPDRAFSGATERAGVSQPALLFELQPGSDIEGVVVGVPSAEAAGLRVRALLVEEDGGGMRFGVGGKMREADVQPDGRFALAGLDRESTWQIQLRARSKRGGRFSGFFGDQARSGPVRAKSGERGVRLTWQNESALVFQVKDRKSGQPVERMRVSVGLRWPQPLMGEDGKPRTSFPEGKVRSGELYPASQEDQVSLEIRAAGYQDYRREDLALLPGADLDLGTIQLEPTPVLVVRVTDAKSGGPLADASVTLRRTPPGGRGDSRSFSFSIGADNGDFVGGPSTDGKGPSRGRTDAEGVVLLTSFPGEACSLRAEAEGHAPFVIEDLTLPEGERVEREVSLGKGGSALVHVLGADGRPLAGARISHRETGAGGRGGPGSDFSFNFGPGGARAPVTDKKGEALVALLAPGRHAFRLDEGASGMRGFGGGRMRIMGETSQSDPWTEVEVVDNEQAEIVLRASPRGSLEGVVREAGQPLAGASVALEPGEAEGPDFGLGGQFALAGGGGDSSARTDGAGRYRIEDLKIGSYTLALEHSSRAMPDSFKVEIREGSNRFDVDLLLTVIEGRITDTKGDPLAGIRVRAEQRQDRDGGGFRSMIMMAIDDGGGEVISVGDPSGTPPGTTDAEGRFALRGVTADVDLVVKAESKEHQPAESEAVRLNPGEIKRDVDLILEAGGEVSVEALQTDGKPARFVMLTARWQGEGSLEPKTSFVGPTGRAKLSGLKPGRWKVEARKMGPGSGGPGGQGGAPPQEKEVEVKPGEKAELSFTLE